MEVHVIHIFRAVIERGGGSLGVLMFGLLHGSDIFLDFQI